MTDHPYPRKLTKFASPSYTGDNWTACVDFSTGVELADDTTGAPPPKTAPEKVQHFYVFVPGDPDL